MTPFSSCGTDFCTYRRCAPFYLNPLAYLALPLGLALIAVLAAESVAGRSLVRWEERFIRWRPFVPILLALGVLFWIPQILFALSRPKPELVDLRNPIAAHLRALIEPVKSRLLDTPRPPPPDPDNGIARQGSSQMSAIPDLASQPGHQQHNGDNHDHPPEPLRPHPDR